MINLAAQCIKMKSGAHADLTAILVDVSQDGGRRPWSGHLRSMTTSSCFYSFSADRLLVGSEHMNIMGFPSHLNLQHLSESAVKDLIGEAFSLPTTSVVVLCLVTGLTDAFVMESV